MEKLKIKVEEAVDNVSKLENLAYVILIITAFLLPVFFIPSLSFSFQFSKSVFVSLAAVVAFALWLIARLKDGRFLLPNNKIFLAAAIILIVYLISSLFSSVVTVSILGQGFELGTWSNLLIMFILMFLFSALFRPKERVFYLYLTLFCSFFLIVAFHVLRFVFGAGFMSFGLFTDITSNLIGKWNDLGIFFSMVSILAMITLELLTLNRLFKILVAIIFGLSLLSLIVVNFSTIWYALLFFSVVFNVYLFAYGREFKSGQTASDNPDEPNRIIVSRKRKAVSILALMVIVVSLVFLADSYTSSRPISTKIADQFKVSHVEVRPNWSSTVYVAKNTLLKDPVFGVGPNRFVNEWLLYKPAGINESIFWNTDFNYGIGLLPTMFVTGGILGGLSWLFLLITLIYVGVKAILSPIEDKNSRYLLISSFFASVYLWVYFVFYIPSTVIVSLTFLFTGIFIASLYNDRVIKAKVISFIEEPKISFVSVLVLTVVLIGVITLGYVFTQKFVASVYSQKALIAINSEGNIDKAEVNGKKAVVLSSNDVYNRFLSELTLVRINNLLSVNQPDASIDSIRSQFQALLGDALNYAREAVNYDSTNYQNWVSLGRVYESVVPLGIEGAYESAFSAYENAVEFNPSSPQLDLNEARLEFAKNDNAKAKESIDKALVKKYNYTEAIFLKSQIQAAEGKLSDAIKSAEDASILAPNDPTVFFQLGLLKYNNRDYRGGAEALERAVLLQPSYANAKYFLGLCYSKLGRKGEALTQFNDILVLNPGNQDVEKVIANIKAGRDAFYEASAEVRPENRDTLPIEEEPVEEEQ